MLLPAVPFLSILTLVATLGVPQAPGCADVPTCRQAALDAAAREEFEAFHDLAWRAMRLGRQNDPELMYMLARAQSLSGRPGDALVMLRRLAEMGITTDAAESDDFRRVRALSAWPELERTLAAVADGGSRQVSGGPVAAPTTATGLPSAVVAPPAATGAPSSAVAPAAGPATALPPAAPPARRGAPASPPASPAASPSPAARPAGAEALRLTATAIDPVGLAYDTASRRFVLGDRSVNKLVVADDVFDHVNDLIGAVAGGFGGLTALTIDERRGDLWVTSSGTEGGASVHRLQLVSGRLLATTVVPEDLRPAHFSDVAVTEGGMLVLADSAGSRLLGMNGTTGRFDRLARLELSGVVSVATAPEGTYIAHEGGLARTDLTSRRLTPVREDVGVSLSGLQRIRWHRGSLIALQDSGARGTRVVRIRLARGGTVASAVEELADHRATAGAALTVSRDAAYYVADAGGVPVIRRVDLR